MQRHDLTDEQWDTIKEEFPPPARTGRPPRDRRVIVNAILWILHTGSPWRDLPSEFGPWKTVWDLFDRWNSDGMLDKILRHLQIEVLEEGKIDNELWCVDGSNIRAARCAGGGGKKTTLGNPPIMR